MLLRTKERLKASDIGKLRSRLDGPFIVTACPSPNAYTLALPCKMRSSPTVNVDRPQPFFVRAGTPPVSDAGQEGEHELPNRRVVRGVTRYLVRWRVHTSTDGCCRRHCVERVAEYDAAAPRLRTAHRAGPVTPHPRLLRRPRRHYIWRPPGFGLRLQRS